MWLFTECSKSVAIHGMCNLGAFRRQSSLLFNGRLIHTTWEDDVMAGPLLLPYRVKDLKSLLIELEALEKLNALLLDMYTTWEAVPFHLGIIKRVEESCSSYIWLLG